MYVYVHVEFVEVTKFVRVKQGGAAGLEFEHGCVRVVGYLVHMKASKVIILLRQEALCSRIFPIERCSSQSSSPYYTTLSISSKPSHIVVNRMKSSLTCRE